jgi:hypothetical protein
MPRVVEAAEDTQNRTLLESVDARGFRGNCGLEDANPAEPVGQTKSDRKERTISNDIGPRLVGGGRLTWNAFGNPSVWLARLDCNSSLLPNL